MEGKSTFEGESGLEGDAGLEEWEKQKGEISF